MEKKDFLHQQLNAFMLLWQKNNNMMHIICSAVVTQLRLLTLLYKLFFNVGLSKFVYNMFPKLSIYVS